MVKKAVLEVGFGGLFGACFGLITFYILLDSPAGSLIIVGIIIVAAIIFMAFDGASLQRKAIRYIVGGAVFGTFLLTPIGVFAGVIAPSSNPVWKDMLFAGLLYGGAGLLIGTFSGAMALGLSILIRYISMVTILKS